MLYLLCCLCNKSQVIGILYIPDASGCWCLVPIREEQSPCGSVLNVPAPSRHVHSLPVHDAIEKEWRKDTTFSDSTFHIEILRASFSSSHMATYLRVHLSNDVRQIVGDLIPRRWLSSREVHRVIFLVRSMKHRCAGVWDTTDLSNICVDIQIW